MAAIIGFVFSIVDGLLQLLIWAIIVNAVMSWLVAFDVINLRNKFVYGVAHFLEAVTRPVMAPVQRIIPPLGGVDISPIVVILVLQGVHSYLLPALQGFLLQFA
ncbi:YggT family protein [Phenylobacterium sp.]|jgi:YggT family protein|uniref:YggT family protein n=1 Tax=Phenylobacterium sp. TaxID=1871053 RepID=UPI002F40B92A